MKGSKARKKADGIRIECSFTSLEEIASLVPNPRNPNTHPPGQVRILAEAIRLRGWRLPIVVSKRSGFITKGHGRLLAAKALGVSHAPVDFQAYLSEAEEWADMIADNQIAELAEMDENELTRLVEELEQRADELALPEGMTIEQYLETLGPIPDLSVVSEKLGKADSLRERFIVPPFTVLDARQGWWRARKQAWIALGIESELGRKGDMVFRGSAQPFSITRVKNEIEKREGRSISWEEFRTLHPELMVGGTSIFDPVLCEVLLRWFCPPGGSVLDPFAGGSVRGIVAARLGFHYDGIELRSEQVRANRRQAKAILGRPKKKTVTVRISSKMANLRFHGCKPDFVREVCHAKCCFSGDKKKGAVVSVLPTEEAVLERLGETRVKDGLLVPKEGKCPFIDVNGACGLHGSPHKPFGCIASPFTLNRSGTLIVRHRYLQLPCYKTEESVPAYEAFGASLELLFGELEAGRIAAKLASGSGDFDAEMPIETWRDVRYLDGVKKGKSSPENSKEAKPGTARWIVGDAATELPKAKGLVDYVFTCPPYFDLEKYSSDVRDISNAQTYEKFLASYRTILERAAARLAENRFFSIVVGDIRNKGGIYRNFVGDTVGIMQSAGLGLYNEAILAIALTSAPIRAGRLFATSRKLCKVHQNVLVFVKGDPKKAVEEVGLPEFGETEPIEEPED